MMRCPAYTEPGTGPYDTAQGASRAPGAENTRAAAAADASYAPTGSSPSTSPSSRSPTSLMDRPAASSAAHQLPETTWLTRARTSQSAHGVERDHWSGPTPATKRRVASSV